MHDPVVDHDHGDNNTTQTYVKLLVLPAWCAERCSKRVWMTVAPVDPIKQQSDCGTAEFVAEIRPCCHVLHQRERFQAVGATVYCLCNGCRGYDSSHRQPSPATRKGNAT